MKHALAMIAVTGMVLSSGASAAELSKGADRITVVKKETNIVREAQRPNATSAEYGYAPRVTLSFPSTIVGGVDTNGTMTWRDPDNKVTRVFLTVFFHDGDVGTVSLFDVRDGDNAASSGRITFAITAAGYDPNLGSNGTVIVTVTDQDYNVTQMSTSFVVR